MFIDNRKVLLKVRAGSHAKKINDEQSDDDFKYFVLPTKDDLYRCKLHKSFTTTDDVYVEVQDIRMLVNQLFNSNPSYLELLFSEIRYVSHVSVLRDLRDEISRINLPSLYDACIGIYHRNVKEMYLRTSEKTGKLIDEFGYNPKKAFMAYHCLRLIRVFLFNDFSDFEEANTYSEGTYEKKFVKTLRRGGLSIGETEGTLRGHYDYATADNIVNAYRKHKPNEELNFHLRNEISKIIFNYYSG